MHKIVFLTPPESFSPKMEVAACYCLVEDKFLFLENSDNKEWAGMWGVPAGKIDPGEEPIEGAIREMFEETGVLLESSHIKPFKHFYIQYPEYDLIYHTFEVKLPHFPERIELRAREHKKFAWLAKNEVLKLPLMPGARACFLSIIGQGENL